MKLRDMTKKKANSTPAQLILWWPLITSAQMLLAFCGPMSLLGIVLRSGDYSFEYLLPHFASAWVCTGALFVSTQWFSQKIGLFPDKPFTKTYIVVVTMLKGPLAWLQIIKN